MPSESSKHGLNNEFIGSFQKKYEEWLLTRNGKTVNTEPKNVETKNVEIKKIIPKQYLCLGTLEKREKKAEEDRVETDSNLPGPEIHGFQNEIKSLQHFLLDQKVYKEFRSLVIVGEYGVGKTALCKMIFNNEGVKSVYAPRIWVSMHSKETEDGEDTKVSVLKRILKGLGVKDLNFFETIREEAATEAGNNLEAEINQVAGEIDRETATEKELSALLYALHLNLRWKKYLIVFDDVRDEDSWNEMLDVKLKEGEKWGKYLSDGFPKGSGGRVIYTARDETVAKKLVAEEHEIHRLWPLTDTESVWKIYEAAIVEYSGEIPRNDKKCKDELMNKSRGLPLAARLLATLLPVFLDTENDDQNGSTNGTSDSVNNRTSEENRPTQP